MTSDPNSKTCSKCGQVKGIASFNKRTNGYWGSWCKPCNNAWRREKYHDSEAHREASRRGRLKHRYGITVEQYEFMLQAQGGVCKICGEVDKAGTKLAVDHCHETGDVRALLCRSCNNTLGFVEKYLRNPAPWDRYLEEHSS